MSIDTSKIKDQARDGIAEALGDAYDCMRVWSAWGVGTMGPDDFALVVEDESRLEEITDAALAPALAVIDAQAAEIAEAKGQVEHLDRQNNVLREALAGAIDLAWVEDSHAVQFDSTVVFGPYYDFDNLHRPSRLEFLAEYECVVWPGNKWSAYCTYEGSMWFERFDTADEAKEACMRLLDKVLPNHPAMRARAALSGESNG